uniref:Putative S-locus glycoprotein domain-containing protein n=1 Tax=Tanacetum cinerariifolium TaxID=118510 RepID=A0A699IGR1_TANCI|nr:putative S-locus glycoprotein domain-containing protein [Tanacetum cinerariifolium]
MASIEQCFELDSMLFDEAVGRLKAYEERIKGAEKMKDIQGGLLLVSEGKSHGCKNCGNGGSNRDGFGRDRERGRGSGKSRDGNERVRDKSHVKCYKCGEFGHYNNECPKWEKHEANLIEEEPTELCNLKSTYSKGIEWRLSSWKSNEDPGRGEFTWEANTHGYRAFELKQRGVLKQRTAPWTNERFTFSGMLSFIVNVFITKTEASYAYHIENNTSILSRLTLNSSGKIVSTVWAEEIKEKLGSVSWNFQIIYVIITTSVVLKEAAILLIWVKSLALAWMSTNFCQGMMIGQVGVLREHHWIAEMDQKDTNIIGEGSTGCLMWFNDLIDIRVSTVTGQDIFVRIASSQIGSSNSSSDPAGFSITLLWYARVKKNKADLVNGKLLDVSENQEAMELPIFSFSRISNSTTGFSLDNKIGEGGFGPVYKKKGWRLQLSVSPGVLAKELMSSRMKASAFQNFSTEILSLPHTLNNDAFQFEFVVIGRCRHEGGLTSVNVVEEEVTVVDSGSKALDSLGFQDVSGSGGEFDYH